MVERRGSGMVPDAGSIGAASGGFIHIALFHGYRDESTSNRAAWTRCSSLKCRYRWLGMKNQSIISSFLSLALGDCDFQRLFSFCFHFFAIQ